MRGDGIITSTTMMHHYTSDMIERKKKYCSSCKYGTRLTGDKYMACGRILKTNEANIFYETFNGKPMRFNSCGDPPGCLNFDEGEPDRH